MTTPADDQPRWMTSAVLLLVACTVLLRVDFWRYTGLTLEDALITARYAENLAGGRGFVYNEGERVCGTTTPLWTLLLAATGGGHDGSLVAAKLLAILFDSLTLLLVVATLRDRFPIAALIFGAAFAFSPVIIPIAVSGMETSLLLFSMAMSFWALHRSSRFFGFALALVVLTRLDGLLFAGIMGGWALMHNPRWALRHLLLAVLVCLPWFLFSTQYFGGPLPQSLLAKRSIYQFDRISSALPVLHLFTPWGESLLSMKGVLKGLLVLLFLLGLFTDAAGDRRVLPLGLFFVAYCLLLATSGMLIFSWYLVPPYIVFLVLAALGMERVVRAIVRFAKAPHAVSVVTVLVLCVVALGSSWSLAARRERAAELQRFEERVRTPIGLWLRDHLPRGSTVLLEPIGYIGYYAGHDRFIRDEMGLVTPEIVALRSGGPGWYVEAVRRLRPDYLVQYTYALAHNRGEGTGVALFRDETQRAWFERCYTRIAVFEDPIVVPWMEEKERSYVILRRTEEW